MKMLRLGLMSSLLGAVFMHADGVEAGGCDRGTFAAAFAGEELVPQNWDCTEREEFWYTDQGSQIMPYRWFLALEQADSEEKFSDPAHLGSFGYLTQKPSRLNIDGLPIGFTRGKPNKSPLMPDFDDEWFGITCAACHTGQVEYRGAKYLIDGAPTLADFEGMFIGLAAALNATLNDQSKLARFAADVGSTEAAVRPLLESLYRIRDEWNNRNQGRSRYGHGRLDAIGAIYNETSATALGDPANAICEGRPCADAPVSYPFIWDTPQHDFVQWNGSVENAGLGALGRNVGEVIGVFGGLELKTSRFSKTGHPNSVSVQGLGRLEELVWSLWSPRWADTSLPDLDPNLVALGEEVYAELCSDCHHGINRSDETRRIEAVMTPVALQPGQAEGDELGTDPAMAQNFLARTVAAPQLTGRHARYWATLSGGEKFEREDEDATLSAKILGYSVSGAIVNSLLKDPIGTLRAMKAGQPNWVVEIIDDATSDMSALDKIMGVRNVLKAIRERIELAVNKPDKAPCFPHGDALCYKARPLNGIWATAPYLHNGSVRTLKQLLLPSSMRDAKFKVGTREFDPVEVGFANDGGSQIDTAKAGNSNQGHEGVRYGTDILAADSHKLEALLEYLKSL